MQTLFPTKKFFIVLFFITLVAVGGVKLFTFLNRNTEKKTPDEQKFAVMQDEFIRSRNNNDTDIEALSENSQKQYTATSTINAVAAVLYLRDQAKINGATMEETVTKVGMKIEEAKQKLDMDTYAKKDIIISSDNSPETIKNYGNGMAAIFINTSNQYHSDETYLIIIKNAFVAKDMDELKKLDPYIHFYKKIISDSLAIKVPSSAVSIHLDIINSYAEILALIQGFQMTSGDLPSSIASNSRLEKSSVRFMDSFKDADNFFKEKGATFLSGEKGGLFAAIASGYIKQ